MTARNPDLAEATRAFLAAVEAFCRTDAVARNPDLTGPVLELGASYFVVKEALKAHDTATAERAEYSARLAKNAERVRLSLVR
jgi:hypothetical protein